MNQTLNETEAVPLPAEPVALAEPTAHEEESDFIDFYQILGLSQNSSTERLSTRIMELYKEAQNNHDHRNPAKRLHYDAMSELLPFTRIILLQPEKRGIYDGHLAAFHRGDSDLPDFESIIKSIIGQSALTTANVTDVIAISDDTDVEPKVQEVPPLPITSQVGPMVESVAVPDEEVNVIEVSDAFGRKTEVSVNLNTSSCSPIEVETVAATSQGSEPTAELVSSAPDASVISIAKVSPVAAEVQLPVMKATTSPFDRKTTLPVAMVTGVALAVALVMLILKLPLVAIIASLIASLGIYLRLKDRIK